jgi:predicted NAD-dependent protein-ADP-ribosyltransferase YbiA (DUF1768 family)
MRILFKSNLLVAVPETDAERAELAAWKEVQAGHVLLLRDDGGEGLALVDLGPRAHACNEPLNVVSFSPDPAARLISNFAATPFVLDGRDYASVEGFWQGLKFPAERDRRRVAALSGSQARDAGEAQPYGPTVAYDGQVVPVGAWGHWQLMERACLAKFAQHAEAREALLSTGERTLVHRVRRDSRTIPGALMADIWMRIRRRLREGPARPGLEGTGEGL